MHASLEPLIHKLFAGFHVSGEWFEFAPEIDKFAQTLRNGANPAEWVFMPDRLMLEQRGVVLDVGKVIREHVRDTPV